MDKSLTIIPPPGDVVSPDGAFDGIVGQVMNTLHSKHTQRAYREALKEFRKWQLSTSEHVLNKRAVDAYRSDLEKRGLSSSTVNKALSAIRKLAEVLVDSEMLTANTAEAIRRVKPAKRQGVRLGNWLSTVQAQELLDSQDQSTMKGKRDLAILALLFGSGLRRVEAATLTIEHLQMRESRFVIVDLEGKHGRVRSVPIAAFVKVAIDRWTTAAGISSGRIFRGISKSGVVGQPMTDQAIYNAVVGHARRLGIKLSPHDCRRTFAQLSRKSGSDLSQLQQTLGHASLITTERYLGIKQDLTDAPSDRIRLKVA